MNTQFDVQTQPLNNNNTLHYSHNLVKLIGYNEQVSCSSQMEREVNQNKNKIGRDQTIKTMNKCTVNKRKPSCVNTNSTACTGNASVPDNITADILRHALYGRLCGPSRSHPIPSE